MSSTDEASGNPTRIVAVKNKNLRIWVALKLGQTEIDECSFASASWHDDQRVTDLSNVWVVVVRSAVQSPKNSQAWLFRARSIAQMVAARGAAVHGVKRSAIGSDFRINKQKTLLHRPLAGND